jgi:hypothetical protein
VASGRDVRENDRGHGAEDDDLRERRIDAPPRALDRAEGERRQGGLIERQRPRDRKERGEGGEPRDADRDRRAVLPQSHRDPRPPASARKSHARMVARLAAGARRDAVGTAPAGGDGEMSSPSSIREAPGGGASQFATSPEVLIWRKPDVRGRGTSLCLDEPGVRGRGTSLWLVETSSETSKKVAVAGGDPAAEVPGGPSPGGCLSRAAGGGETAGSARLGRVVANTKLRGRQERHASKLRRGRLNVQPANERPAGRHAVSWSVVLVRARAQLAVERPAVDAEDLRRERLVAAGAL